MSLLGNTAELAILLKLKDEFTGPLNKADHALSGINSRAGMVAGGLGTMGKGLAVAAERIAAIGITAGVAIGGIAISATKSAASFESAMNLIQTQAGASTQEVQTMSKAILAMAGSVGTSPDVLATGLYHIESAGIRGAKALDVLKTAAQGAAVGGSDLESTTNALIAAVNSGVGGVSSMGQAMGVLNGIVGNGNMRMQDLVDALGTGLLTKAKTFGVSIQSVGAALADMTNQGVPAVQAATMIGSSFRLMGAPTSKATTELKSIGLAQLDLANAMRGPTGMVGAIELLGSKMAKAGLLDKNGNPNAKGADLLTTAFGGKQSTAILALIGNMTKIPGILDAINKSSGGFGAAFATKAAEVDFKVGAVRGQLDALKITLGERLLPVAGTILDELSKVLGSPAAIGMADQFGQAIAGIFTQDNISRAEQFIGQIAYFAKSIIPPLISGMQIAGQLVAGAVGAFTSLPAALQVMIIGGLAVNKLSGGLVASGLKQVAQGLLTGGGGSGGGGGVVGGLLGVQKVFVVNMGAGGMGGGGLPGGAAPAAAGAAAETGWAAGGIAGLGALVVSVIGSAAVAAAIIGIENQLTGTTAADIAKANVHGQFGPRSMDNVAPVVLPSSSGGTGGNVGSDLYPTQTGGLKAVNQLSGNITGALGAGRLGPSGAALAQSLVGVFAQSTSPSLHSMVSGLGQMTAMEARYLAQGDTKLAAAIAANIRYLSGRVDAVTAAINAKQFVATSLTRVLPMFFPDPTKTPGSSGGTGGNVGGDPYPAKPKPKPGTATVPVVNSATGFTINVHPAGSTARDNATAAVIKGRWGPTIAGGQAVVT